MSLHGKEKIWFLVNRLLDEREITPKDEPIGLHLANDLNRHYELQDLLALSEKLEKEHNAVKVVSLPTDQTGLKVLFELLPSFDAYVQELRKDPKYLEWMGEKPEPDKEQSKISFASSRARKNGVMTGKEKITAVVEAINDEYQGLVTGNKVTVHSSNLESRGIKLAEQSQVLNILTNDKRVIKYTAKPTFESQADIPPSDQVDVYEIASDVGKTPEEMFAEMLEQQDYNVEVLSGFEALADEMLGNAELEYQQDVYLLRLLYNRLIVILDAVVENAVVVEDDELDYAYVHLLAYIDDLLAKPELKKWKDDAPEIYETLMGNSEDIGEGWQYKRSEILKYFAKLKKEWMLQGKPEFSVDDKVSAVFKQTDELVAKHRQITKRASDNWHKNAERFAKDFKQQFNSSNADQSKEQPKPQKPTDTEDRIRFDAKDGVLSFGGKSCNIPDESLEYYICKFAFKNRRVAAKEDDILEKSVKSQDSQRAVYDAMLRVNKKAREQLGIEKLLQYKAAKIRIVKKYQ